MAIFPVLIDVRPAYLPSNGVPRSLLLAPMGTRSLLAHTHERVATVTDEAPTILTTFAADRDYSARLLNTGVPIDAVVSLDDIDKLLDRLELSDSLLVVDPRCFPAQKTGLTKLLDRLGGSPGARHLVAMETSRRGTKEFVQLDAQGRVRRIQRYFDGVTLLHTRAVAASLIPIGVARETPSSAFRDLAALREALVTAGVMSRDIDLRAGVFDLNREPGLLQLCEHCVCGLASDTPPPGYNAPAPGIWIGPHCAIDPTARLYGPVVLQEGVRVDADVRLIGPLAAGAGSHVRRSAVLAQCVVAAETDVPERTTFHCRVLCGDDGDRPLSTVEPWHESRVERSSEQLCVGLSQQLEAGRGVKARREVYIAVKRMVEGVVALLGLIVLAPLLAAVAAGIKLTSRGPVFFFHEREGRDGRPFRCCKFRTMVADAHRQQRALYSESTVDGPQFDLRDDPRITWLGHWLRLTNVDELPQLFHVVLGQMSLIGPRPSPFRENQICVPWREARLAVRPGITGLWQICRHERSAGDFHQWIYYDMLYVRHVSVWLDLKIFLTTLLTAAGRWSVPLTWIIPVKRLRDDHDRPGGGQAVRVPTSSRLTSGGNEPAGRVAEMRGAR